MRIILKDMGVMHAMLSLTLTTYLFSSEGRREKFFMKLVKSNFLTFLTIVKIVKFLGLKREMVSFHPFFID